MAAATVGSKRSYRQMSGIDHRGPIRSTKAQGQSTTGIRHQNPNVSSNLSERLVSMSSPTLQSCEVSFEPSASIVLIGIRGVGKSTLGVFAATAYNRRLIDSEKRFLKVTGKSSLEYRKLYGSDRYHERHNRILEDTLQSHSAGAVIICNFSDLECNGTAIIKRYAETHPVVHITRDSKGIQSYLQRWSAERIDQLLIATSPLLRSCSSFEFFNLTETDAICGNSIDSELSDGARQSTASSLALKRVEQEFLRLLCHIIKGHEHASSQISAYPLSQISFQEREHTFAVTVRVSEVLAEKLDLEEMQTGADCVDVVVDVDDPTGTPALINISRAFALIRRSNNLPIMASFYYGDHPHQERPQILFTLARYCIRLGIDFCTVDISLEEAQIRDLIAESRATTMISVHNFETSPPHGWYDDDCLKIYEKAARLNCEVVKITMPAETVQEAHAVHHFRQRIHELHQRPHLIPYSTGSRGNVSKCSNAMLTSVEPFVGSHCGRKTRDTYDEPITARVITQALFASFILEPMRFYVYGADVSRSLSPAMHQVAYDACGMVYTYEKYSSDGLDEFVKLARQERFGGSAIAPPFKTSVLALLDGVSRHAKAIGAVNTVVPIRDRSPNCDLPPEVELIAQRQQSGPIRKLFGFNTDWIGIRACVRKGLSPANAVRSHSTALICGAGGMARAAIYALVSLGVQNIFIYNRTLNNAAVLAEYYTDLISSGGLSELRYGNENLPRVRVLESFAVDWPNGFRQPTMIVSCIPRETGDHFVTNFCLPDTWLKSPTGGVFVELAHSEMRSLLAARIEERKEPAWVFKDGFDMIPEQAFAQFEIFTSRRAPRKLMRQEMLRHAPPRTR